MSKFLLRDAMRRLAGTAAVVFLAVGVLGSSQALAGIADTKHNLGTSTNAGTSANVFSGTGEICVFCHTPHGADTSASVPLWNRTLAAASTYITYNSLGTSSLDGATAPVGSVSLACLSCHDGAQAMNVLINAPGSGLTNATFTAGTWTGNGGATGLPVGVALIGKDLTNDHPVGIQYGGGMPGVGGAYTKGTIAAGALKDGDFKALAWANLNGNDVWWVDTAGGTAAREKTDMQLYTRTGADSVTYPGGVRTVNAGALAGAQPFVECASCHDPHSSANATFLRIANTGSAVCLACHTK